VLTTPSALTPRNLVIVRLNVRHARTPGETYRMDGNDVIRHEGEFAMHCLLWHVSDLSL
jgi:hypothetical protein